MRRLLVLLLVLLPSVAEAQNIKATEVSAQLFRQRARGTPSLSGASECKFWTDSSTVVPKVSCAGRSPTTLTGGGNGTTSCSETGGTLTCPAFDSPADAAIGGCLTMKEGSNNGSNTSKICAANSLGSSNIITTTSTGLLPTNELGTETAADLGLPLRTNATTGVVEAIPEAAAIYLPTGGEVSPQTAASSAIPALSGNNDMHCATFTARDTIIGATTMSINVSAASGSCTVCLYQAGDAGALIAPLTSGSPSATFDCSGTGIETKTVDAFNVQAGVQYRLCYTGSNTTFRLVQGAQYDNSVVNLVTNTAGQVADSTSAVCPTTTGAIVTPGSAHAPVVRLGQ